VTRAVIVAPQALDYIAAFLGALQARFIAVPLSSPMGGAHDECVNCSGASESTHQAASVDQRRRLLGDVAAAVDGVLVGRYTKMVKLTSRLVVAVGALALSWTTGAGVASAEPDLSPLINTTCSYSQAEAALNALSPDAAEEFYAYPMAQTWLRTFLDSPVDQRRQFVQQAQSIPALQQYTALGVAMANTCKKYPAA